MAAKGSIAFDSLMQVSYLANISLDLDEALPKTVAGIAGLINADRITVLQEDQGCVGVRAVWAGPRASSHVQWHQVYNKAEFPLLCPRHAIEYDTSRPDTPPLPQVLPYLIGEQSVYGLLVPLAIDDVSIGRLDILRRPNGGGFSAPERHFAEACGRILSLAVRNGMEYARVAWLADHDPLTGIGNRRCFDLALTREISRAQRYGRPLTLLLIDLDDFKEANTQLGLSGGDEILRRIANVLARGARQGVDVPCRIGGDEFALVLPEINELSADELVHRLMKDVVRVTTPLWPMRFSYSIATYPAVSPEDLRRSADSRLRDAKVRKREAVGPNLKVVQ